MLVDLCICLTKICLLREPLQLISLLTVTGKYIFMVGTTFDARVVHCSLQFNAVRFTRCCLAFIHRHFSYLHTMEISVYDVPGVRAESFIAETPNQCTEKTIHQGIGVPLSQCHKPMNSMRALETKGLWKMGEPMMPIP
jgi:hypothetical protein